jgi:ISXO2-like transposase domain
MTHRIREAMANGNGGLLKGTVEVDETYIGGESKRRGGRVRNQKPGLRNSTWWWVWASGRAAYVLFTPPMARNRRSAQAISKNVNPPAANIYSDSAAVYDFSMRPHLKPRHQMVNYTMQWVVPETDIPTNTVESAFHC